MQKTELKEVGKKDLQVRMIASPITGFDLLTVRGMN